jgi:hypothetical protein
MAKEVKIEKGIKLPPSSGGGKPIMDHPMRLMKVGDSFLTDVKASGHANCTGWSERTGFKYATRRLPHEGGFVRVWRVK